LANSWRRERPLRILEIGAGTGGTTTFLLPLLDADRTVYTFTDLSIFFTNKAKEKFETYPFVRYGLLNIEDPPQDQGYESHSFDVVVAANVLHGTRDLDVTLRNVVSLLAPGGILLLEEATRWERAFSITIALIEGLTRHEDSWRDQVPFMTASRWKEALRHNGFVEVASLPETDEAGGHVLIAQAPQSSPFKPAHTSEDDLRAYLRERLPEYMIPSAFVILDSMPLTSNGKVNRRALPAPARGRQRLSGEFVAPRNREEKVLADIWANVLNLHQVGIDDNFFELGGDSILSVQAVARANQSGIKLTPTLLFHYPTIAQLTPLAEVSILHDEDQQDPGGSRHSLTRFPVAAIDEAALEAAFEQVEFEE
jgi:SAM-dependent methyltransferase